MSLSLSFIPRLGEIWIPGGVHKEWEDPPPIGGFSALARPNGTVPVMVLFCTSNEGGQVVTAFL